MLLLDEPTASMDTMREMRPVDRIIWLEAGKLMAEGPKAEVLKRMSGQAA